jgi:nitrite reductase (NO-forming)
MERVEHELVGVPHDLAIPDLKIQSSLLAAKDKRSQVVIQANEPGEFSYYCTVSGHRQAGMEGKLVVKAHSLIGESK